MYVMTGSLCFYMALQDWKDVGQDEVMQINIDNNIDSQ